MGQIFQNYCLNKKVYDVINFFIFFYVKIKKIIFHYILKLRSRKRKTNKFEYKKLSFWKLKQLTFIRHFMDKFWIHIELG